MMHESSRTFGDVVDTHQFEVLRYLRRLTNDPTEADDLFQETFLRALRGFDRLREGSNHRAWVYRIATNVFLNHRRGQRRRNEVPLTDELPASGASPAGRYRAGAAVAACHQAIAALPPRQRAAFMQRNVLGLTYAEVAHAMGSTPAAARANVYQAARRLRRELSDMEA